MKTRQGFVSNSSSSSFILSIAKKPESIAEMQTLLFKDKEFYYDPYYDGDSGYFSNRTEKYPASQVAETVFDDIRDQKPMSAEQVAEEMSSGWLDGGPDYNSFKKDGNIDWKDYQKACDSFNLKCAKELITEAKGKELYVVEYSDDDSYGCALEHGNLFDNIDNYRISKH